MKSGRRKEPCISKIENERTRQREAVERWEWRTKNFIRLIKGNGEMKGSILERAAYVETASLDESHTGR